jgi:hypothetical protein
MRRLACLLTVAWLLAVAVPGCNIFNDIGNAECLLRPTACCCGLAPSSSRLRAHPGGRAVACHMAAGSSTSVSVSVRM